MPSIDSLVNTVHAALGSPAATDPERDMALALLNEELLRVSPGCRAAFLVHVHPSERRGQVELVLFAPERVAGNLEGLGTHRTDSLFADVHAVRADGRVACVKRDRVRLPREGLCWALFTRLDPVRAVITTTLLTSLRNNGGDA